MSYLVLEYYGIMLRFIIESYTPLKPDLKKDFQVIGINILCAYRSTIHLEKNENRNTTIYDSQKLTSLDHCNLFHELIDHKNVSIAELTQIDFIWVDYEFTLQRKIKGWKL